jgi:hypothetical protein
VDGLKLEPNSGVVWRVTPEPDGAGLPFGISRLYAALGSLALVVVTFFLLRGRGAPRSPGKGLLYGVIAGLVMGVAAMLVSAVVLDLPWYAPPRVFSTMVMGRAGVANILEFVWLPFIVGLAVVVVLTGLLGLLFAFVLRARETWRVVLGGLAYGLTAWALLQYFVLAELFPLVAEKGFPPFWYGVAFAIYGLTLGLLFAYVARRPADTASD